MINLKLEICNFLSSNIWSSKIKRDWENLARLHYLIQFNFEFFLIIFILNTAQISILWPIYAANIPHVNLCRHFLSWCALNFCILSDLVCLKFGYIIFQCMINLTFRLRLDCFSSDLFLLWAYKFFSIVFIKGWAGIRLFILFNLFKLIL